LTTCRTPSFLIRLAVAAALLPASGMWASSRLHAETTPLVPLVRRALDRSPLLRAAAARRDEALAGRREVRAQRWPALRARASFTRGDDPVYVFGSLLQQQAFTPAHFAVDVLNDPGYYNHAIGSLELGAPLFAGGTLTTQARLAALGAEQADRWGEAQRQKLRFDAAQAALEVLLRRRQLAALDETIASSRREVEDARRLKEKGLVLGSDYFAAEAILSGLQAWRRQLAARREDAEARLAERTSTAPGELEPAGELAEAAYDVPSEADLLARAVRERPDLAAARLRADGAELERRQAGRGAWPRVEAFAAVEAHTEDFSSAPTDRVGGVRASLFLGDPAYGARREKTRLRAQAGRDEAAGAEEQARLEVRQARRAHAAATETLPLTRETMDRARRSLELFRPLHREGRQSIIEVLRAEEALARAENAYWETVHGVHASFLALRLAAGSLDDAALADVERRLEAKP
jgi:outer membrane protein TolC